jgi:hypothetical protein
MRRIAAALYLAATVAACSTARPTGGGGDAAAILKAATNASAHVCAAVPAALIETIVPGAAAPTEGQLPPRCSWSNGTVSLAVDLDVANALGDTPVGAEAISDVGARAYFQRLPPIDYYLSVAITKDLGLFHIEINNQDGRDYAEAAINVAKAILSGFGA